MSSRRTLSWKKDWKTLIWRAKGILLSLRGHRGAGGVPWGWPCCSVCADTTSDIFILCCFHFMCNKFTQDGRRGSWHPTAGMWHVPIPPDRIWMMRTGGQSTVWTHWCCSDPEVSPVSLCPAQPGWLQSKSLFIFCWITQMGSCQKQSLLSSKFDHIQQKSA